MYPEALSRIVVKLSRMSCPSHLVWSGLAYQINASSRQIAAGARTRALSDAGMFGCLAVLSKRQVHLAAALRHQTFLLSSKYALSLFLPFSPQLQQILCLLLRRFHPVTHPGHQVISHPALPFSGCDCFLAWGSAFLFPFSSPF